MEIHIVVDDGEPCPGQYLTGTVYLHLTSYLPRRALPSPPSRLPLPFDDEDAELAYLEQLEAERLRLLQSSPPIPAVPERTELLDVLQLQILGKCLPDSSKLSHTALKSFSPSAADSPSFLLYSSPAVTLERFDQPLPFDVLHQPYTYEFSALLPPSLPPSYRGASHRIVYYVSVVALKRRKAGTAPLVVADVKVPFRVRVSELYYHPATAAAEMDVPLPTDLRTPLHHARLHPSDLEEIDEDQERDKETGAEAVEERLHRLLREGGAPLKRADSVGLRQKNADASIPVPPRGLFTPETLDRKAQGGEDSAAQQMRALSLSPASAPSQPGSSPSTAMDSPSSSPPLLSPPPDYRAIHALLQRYKRIQLAGDPLADSPPSSAPAPSTLSSFLADIRTPLSFNISEQAISSASAAQSLPVTLLVLERSAFRPGDAVRGHFDFSSAVLPCYRIIAHLVWVEEVKGPGGAIVGQQVSQVASEHWYCRQALLLPFSLALPSDQPCNFSTQLVRCSWRLRFKFVVGTPKQQQTVSKGTGGWFGGGGRGGGGEKGAEEADELHKEKERMLGWAAYDKEGAVGSTAIVGALIAPDSALDVSCLQWELPLDVLPVYDQSISAVPAIKSSLIDVEVIE